MWLLEQQQTRLMIILLIINQLIPNLRVWGEVFKCPDFSDQQPKSFTDIHTQFAMFGLIKLL